MGDALTHLGSTRSCHQPNHLLQTPDTFVPAPLPGMSKGVAIVHAAPRMGARFTQYSAELEAGGSVAPNGSQRFIFVVSGSVQADANLPGGGFCYLPPDSMQTIVASETSHIVIIEKPYQAVEGIGPADSFSGDISKIQATPLMGDEDVRVQVLIPEGPQFDFAVNVMTFEPGAALAMVEIHVMEHGLMMLNGGGIYRLGDCWHPVTEGDFIWMAPYCPQWFGAIGKKPAQYLIYKDWNRAPRVER